MWPKIRPYVAENQPTNKCGRNQNCREGKFHSRTVNMSRTKNAKIYGTERFTMGKSPCTQPVQSKPVRLYFTAYQNGNVIKTLNAPAKSQPRTKKLLSTRSATRATINPFRPTRKQQACRQTRTG